MKVFIDPNAGPCTGVKRALLLTEEQLKKNKELLALGPIIHNSEEVQRLEKKGLRVIDQSRVEDGEIDLVKNKRIFIRTHGITQRLHDELGKNGCEIIDGTCPTVISVQNKIKEFHLKGYQIIIVGKKEHPEVQGLNGYCDNSAVIIKDEGDFQKVKSVKSLLISQTTFDKEKFLSLKKRLLERLSECIVKDTTCWQISKRYENLRNFVNSVDVLLLVGGKKSSNTSVLFNICIENNPRSFWIENSNEIKKTWFKESDSVGISGSASTPVWQLEKVKTKLKNMSINSH